MDISKFRHYNGLRVIDSSHTVHTLRPHDWWMVVNVLYTEILAALGERSGLPQNKLRYVVDFFIGMRSGPEAEKTAAVLLLPLWALASQQLVLTSTSSSYEHGHQRIAHPWKWPQLGTNTSGQCGDLLS